MDDGDDDDTDGDDTDDDDTDDDIDDDDDDDNDDDDNDGDDLQYFLSCMFQDVIIIISFLIMHGGNMRLFTLP